MVFHFALGQGFNTFYALDYANSPDFVGTELGYMAFLIGKEKDAWKAGDSALARVYQLRQIEFIEHLEWMQNLDGKGTTPFYNAQGTSTAGMIDSDIKYLKMHPRFLFDERRAGTDTLDYEYSKVAQILRQQGSKVDSTTNHLTSSLLSNYDILVITCPHGSYTTSELQAIESFAQGGGGLLLMGQWGISDPTGINQVAGLFGVNFMGTGAVRDPDMGVDEFMPTITQFDRYRNQ